MQSVPESLIFLSGSGILRGHGSASSDSSANGAFGRLLGYRHLVAENLVLRQQLAAFKANGCRPRIRTMDRAFWVAARRLWSRWAGALVIVKPETVVRWHRTHCSLAKETPARRSMQPRPSATAEVFALPRVGGLHHRYEWRDAA